MSSIQLGKYRASFSFIERLYASKKHDDFDLLVSEMAVASGVPCIVVAHYLQEIAGPQEQLNNTIINLKLFYNYGIIEE